jgi:hypothetical protein
VDEQLRRSERDPDGSSRPQTAQVATGGGYRGRSR